MRRPFQAVIELMGYLLKIIYFFVVSIPVFLIVSAGAIAAITIRDGGHFIGRHIFKRKRQ